MKPAPFRLLKPTTLGEALELLHRYPGEARPLAGGQSLIPMMNFRLARPQYLVDLHGIAELHGIRQEQDGLWIGAMTTHAEVERSPLVTKLCPMVASVVGQIGYPAIRHRGTAGGSLAHADPAAEWPLLVQLLQGEIIITGPQPGDESRLAPEEFFLTVFTTILQPDQLLTAIWLPATVDAGWGFHKFSRRYGDFGLANAGALIRLHSDGTCAEVRVAVGAVAEVPVVLTEITDQAAGQPASEQLWRSIANEYAAQIEPVDDAQISADYRRQLVRVLVFRALRDAAERCKKLQAVVS